VASGAAGADAAWFIGIVCSVSGSVGSAMGLVVQKLAHNQQDRLPDGQKRLEFFGIQFNFMWFLGFFLLVAVPMPLSLAAAAMAPQSIVGPLSAVTIVFCQVFAPLILGERPSWLDWFASVLIIGGCIASSFFGDQCSYTYTLPQIKDLFSNHKFLWFEAFVVCAIVASYCLLCCTSRFSKLPRHQQVMKSVAHASLAGIYAGQQNIFFKAIGETLGKIFSGSGEWKDGFFYVTLVACITIATAQICHLNLGMQLIDAVKYLPMYNASLIINSTVAGLIFYQEYREITALGVTMSAIFWGIILFGAIIRMFTHAQLILQVGLLAAGASGDKEITKKHVNYLPDGVHNQGMADPTEEDALLKFHAPGQKGDDKEALLGR